MTDPSPSGDEPGASAGLGAPLELQAGRVGRPHGLDGSFYVTDPRPRLLQAGTPLHVAGRARRIVRRAGLDAHPIVRLEGIEDRAAAEALRGGPLTIELADAPSLPEGEWWEHELRGCAVLDGERAVGTVAELIELPSCEVLRVARPDGEELLVPLVKDAIRSVDVQARRIDVDLAFLGEG